MAVAFVFESEKMQADQYRGLMHEIGRADVTSDLPPGAIAHLAGPWGDGWRLIDVWEDEASARKFYDTARAAFTGQSEMPPIKSSPWALSRCETAQVVAQSS